MWRSRATGPGKSRSIARATSTIWSMKSPAATALPSSRSTGRPSRGFGGVDAKQACDRSLSLGAEAADIPSAQKTLDVPAIKGIGGSLLYFVDRYGAKGSAYDAEFEWTSAKNPRPEGAGLFYLDHLTHNVHRGRMDVWTGFYERLFNFRQIRFFDIEGRASGLSS